MPVSSEKLNLRTLDGGDVELDLSLLASIGEEGRLRPGDPGFDDATSIWNGLIDKEPALVIQPGSSDEVAFAVNLAREQRLLFSIKGGGHNISGLALADGG
ncbi:MAG: FAD-binding protein, partial [Acidimicrobiia bacterium]